MSLVRSYRPPAGRRLLRGLKEASTFGGSWGARCARPVRRAGRCPAARTRPVCVYFYALPLVKNILAEPCDRRRCQCAARPALNAACASYLAPPLPWCACTGSVSCEIWFALWRFHRIKILNSCSSNQLIVPVAAGGTQLGVDTAGEVLERGLRRGRSSAQPLAPTGGAPRQPHGEGPGRKRGGLPSIRSRGQGS
jgi:hypothetical protein